MLERLAKNDKTWRKMALTICGNTTLADDLVQDMYLKIHRILQDDPAKPITERYIYLTLKSLFITHIRKKKEFCNELNWLKDEQAICEIEQREQEQEFQDKLQVVKEKLTLPERSAIQLTYNRSYRKVAEEIGIVSYSWLYKYVQRSLKKIS